MMPLVVVAARQVGPQGGDGVGRLAGADIGQQRADRAGMIGLGGQDGACSLDDSRGSSASAPRRHRR